MYIISYGWAMSKKLPVEDCKCVKDISEFDESFIKSYNEESAKEYFLEFHFQCQEHLHSFLKVLPFLPERMNVEKVQKFVAILHNKTEFAVYMRNIKQGLSHGLVLKKVHRVIHFNQKFVLKPYIDINNDLRKVPTNNFGKEFFRLMNN